MKSLNQVQLIGNLGKDPEVKYTQSGTPVAKFSIATNESFKDKKGEWQERTDWHTVVVWARLAEIVKEYLSKGDKVYISGRLQTRSWDDAGTKRYATEVIGADLIMLSTQKKRDQKTDQATADAAPAAGSPITDEDIPF